MDPNETTLDTLRPVPQKWDGAAPTVVRNC